MNTKAKVAAAGLAGVIAGTAGIASATTGTSSTTTPAAAQQTASSTPKKAHAHHRRALAARALHGQFTVMRAGKPTVLDAQRGDLTVNGTALTLKSKDGFTQIYTITPTTKVREKGKSVPASSLTNGEKATVVALDNGGHPQALVVRGVHAPKAG